MNGLCAKLSALILCGEFVLLSVGWPRQFRANVSVVACGVYRHAQRGLEAYRAISTGKLNALLRLHTRPIDVMVYHGSRRDLVLRGASRLDAFSGYPVRT